MPSNKRQTRFNFYYNHEYVGCAMSLQKDQYFLRCEVLPKKKKVPESYFEKFYVNDKSCFVVKNRGKFPAEPGLLEKKMGYYIHKYKEILKEEAK